MGDFDDFDELGVSDERDDVIKCSRTHRGVGLHDGQPAARLKVVRRDIDMVFATDAVDTLVALAGNVRVAPEARLLSAAKLEAMFQDAVEKRHERPPFSRARLKLMVNALDSKTWRDPHFYGTLLDIRSCHGIRREGPLGPDE